MTNKPLKVYIAGKITGNEFYKLEFMELRKWLQSVFPNVTVINPASLPMGLSKADYARICFAMIDSADLVVFQSNMSDSDGCWLECDYCDYIDKPYAILHDEPDDESYCPECDKPVQIGYAYGEHFVIGSDTHCPCCDNFKIMHAHNVDELNCWEVYAAMWKAQKARNMHDETECEWVDDWVNRPIYKCCSCGSYFSGKVNFCEMCGKTITGERGVGGGDMAARK